MTSADVFSERFREQKALKGLTFSMIAEKLGLKQRVVEYYASGDRKPDFEGMIALAELFGVSLDYLVGLSDDPARH